MNLKRFLRSPRVIVAEAAAVVLAGVASATITQHPSPAERVRLEERHPVGAAVVRALRLDDVVGSGWFMAVVLLAAASLAVVLWEQWRRAAREWRAPLAESHFRSAPYRLEFARQAREGAPAAMFRTTGRIGLLGSPVFHLGLMVVLGAGVARTLFAVEAVVDLYEGEWLEATPRAYASHWTGPLAAPFAFPVALELGELEIRRYASGALERMSAPVRLAGDPDGAARILAINEPLERAGRSLYLTQTFGVTAFVELTAPEGTSRGAYLLHRTGAEYRGRIGALGREVRLRALATDAPRPVPAVQARVLRDGALLGVAQLDIGGAATFPDGSTLRLADVRWWVRLSGTRDGSAVPAYIGFGLLLLGAVIMFGVVRVDTAVLVSRDGDRDRVLVALRAQRFAPMFADTFRRLVEREGGTVPGRPEA